MAGSAPRNDDVLAETVDVTRALDTPPDSDSFHNAETVHYRAHCSFNQACHTSETRLLHQVRLQRSAVLLLIAFAVFVMRDLFFPFLRGDDPARFDLLVGTTVVLAGTALWLSLARLQCGIRLSLAELAVFGLPTAFFLVNQYGEVHQCALAGSADSPLPPWILLMTIYALFIPNSWQRGGLVLGALALAPVLAVGSLILHDPECGAVWLWEPYTRLVLSAAIAWGSLTYGIHTIHSLRREVFDARRFGQYLLRERLGGGGMGEVYLAEHHLLKRPAALKLIQPTRAGDAKAIQRFEREVRATARLSHLNTVEIYDYGQTDDGQFYYVMELLRGKSLAEVIAEHGPLPVGRTLYLLDQVCGALGEAHGKGLLHRDLKPANIFVAERGGVYDIAKLLDFGLVKPIEARVDRSDITQEGMVTGSPLYMSPEQASGDERIDERSDLYSLGIVAYQSITGHVPFEADNPMKVLIAHARDMPLPPSHWEPDLPEDFETIVLRCLEKRPEDRYRSVDELRAALRSCRDWGTWDEHRAARWWRDVQLPEYPVGSPERPELATA